MLVIDLGQSSGGALDGQSSLKLAGAVDPALHVNTAQCQIGDGRLKHHVRADRSEGDTLEGCLTAASYKPESERQLVL